MIYIRKRRTPISIKKASDNIKKIQLVAIEQLVFQVTRLSLESYLKECLKMK